MHAKTQAADAAPPAVPPDRTLGPISLTGLDLARPEDAFEALRRIAADAAPLHGERQPLDRTT